MKRASLLVVPVLALGAAVGCLDDIELPPDPPTLDLIGDVLRTKNLKGGKPSGTSVILGEDPGSAVEIAPVDDADVWRATVELVPGENALVLWSRTESGLVSYEPLRATVVFEPAFPDPVTIDQPLEIFTNVTPVALSGTKPLATAVIAIDNGGGDEVELAPLGDDVVWSGEVAFDAEASKSFSIVAEDARGKRSEPVDMIITYDVTAPAIAARFPEDGDQGAPNGVISLLLSEPVALDPAALPEALVDVKNGLIAIPGFLVSYVPDTHALRVAPPAGGWPVSSTVTVRLDQTALADLAGNVSTRAADFILQVEIGDSDDTTVPAAPVLTSPSPSPDADGDGALELFSATVSDKTLTLVGTKEPATSLLINGNERVALSNDTSFTVVIALARGENVFRLTAMSPAQQTSGDLRVEVTRVVQPPRPPTVDAYPPLVEDGEVPLTGTRDSNTTLLLDGVPVVPRGVETDWNFIIELNPGTNTRLLFARLVDEGEVLDSEPVAITIELAQEYAGNVAEDAELEVSFRLKDLSQSDPIRGEFETGSNNYGVDIWIEGPLSPGETCVFSGGERQGIKYADTIVHYKGSKTGHITPWADVDYRSPDFLAALVTAGRLPNYAASSDRRTDDGAPNAGFGSPVNIGEAEVDAIDGVTAATIKNGETHSYTWRQSESTRPPLAQGEYLVHIVLNLDRSGTWLADNDVETCWLDPEFAAQGMHRVTARMSLGDIAYEQPLGETNELSGPDVDAEEGVLRFLDGPLTVTWRP